MKKFIINLLGVVVLFVLVVLFLIALPPGNCFQESYLAAQIDKNESLKLNNSSNRIILLGGSSAAFGINSESISKEFQINVINNSLHAGLGLRFMLVNCREFIRKGDVVILVPEYHHFYDNYMYGEEVLSRLLVNTSIANFRHLSFEHVFFQTQSILKMAFHKINYVSCSEQNQLYKRDKFNVFGDFIGHLNHQPVRQIPISVQEIKSLVINQSAIDEIKSFESHIHEIGAQLFIAFPAYQKESFNKNEKQVNLVHDQLIKEEISVLGEPEQLMFNNYFLYDSPYHLNAKGRNIWTEKLILLMKNLIIEKNEY